VPLLGSTTPRLWTPPLATGRPGPCGCGCALTPATSLGFSAVAFARDVLEIEPLPWQRWLLIHALELRKDGRFRFRTVLILVARQNGKTTSVEIKNLWKMFVLQVPLIIGTAQNLDISEESWDKAVEIAESVPELAAEIAHVDKTNGKKALKLVSGSRWKIAAASRKGGRGLSGDDVNLDELREHQSWDSWGAVTKTTMARRNAQVFAFSNAGDDKSVVLNELQAKGRAVAAALADLLAQRPGADVESIAADTGLDLSFGLFEWSAPDDVACTCGREGSDPHTADCQLQDRRIWAMANPSLGYTITEEAIASALATDPVPVFLTEVLCQRVPSLVEESVISPEQWAAMADPTSTASDDIAIAVDVTPDRAWSAIAIASPRPEGGMHLELIDHRRGTAWVVDRLVELRERYSPVAICLDAKGPAGSLVTDLEKAGITLPADPERPERGDLILPTYSEVAAACGQLLDAARDGTDRHIDQAQLTTAVLGAKTRPLGDAVAWHLISELECGFFFD